MSGFDTIGHFSENGYCFNITGEPPRKWFNTFVNGIAQDEIYAVVSHLNDGDVTLRDEVGNECKLIDYDSTCVYVRDDEDNTTFNPMGQPCPQSINNQSCKIYPWMNEWSGSCNGIFSRLRTFVPANTAVLIWDMVVRNDSDRARKVSTFAYARFSLTGRDQNAQQIWNNNRASIHPEFGGVFVKNFNQCVPTDRYNGYIFALDGFTAANGYRDHFTRADYSLSTPKILWGWNCDNRGDKGPDSAGIIQCSDTLAPGEERRYVFVLGQASDTNEVTQIKSEISYDRVDAWLAEQEAIERQRADSFRIDIGNDHHNALVNCWVKKQFMTYLVNKSGFRDNLQTDYAMAMVDYPVAKDNLLRALASQWADGCVPHGFRPLVRLKYSDKPAWIFLAVPWLIKESGDLNFLQEQVPYLESDEVGSVWDHMIRTMRYMLNDLGPNGLSNQHYADWNDDLESTPEAGERESIMVTQQLAYGLREMIELAKRSGDTAIATEAQTAYDTICTNLNDTAWDGDWYIRTICEDGYRVGSKENKEAQFWMNTQSWAILSGCANDQRGKRCLEIVDERLECDEGFMVLNPPFTKYDPRVGNISNKIPYTEINGGCYNHAAGFKCVADCMMGRPEQAWRTWQKITPNSKWLPTERSGAEPFSYNNFYVKDEPDHPVYAWKAGYPWRTGTAAWFTVALIEWILGVRRDYDGLLIDPCLSKDIPKASLSRNFRGATYHIHIDNSAGRCTGTTSITVDGKLLDGNLLPCFDSGEHTVEVVI